MDSAVFNKVPPFYFLSEEEKSDLFESSLKQNYFSGELICSPDDGNYDFMFLLLSGSISVYQHVKDSDPMQVHNAPTYFGELSVIFFQPRSAAVRANCKLSCLRIKGRDIRSLIAKNPTFGMAFANVLRNKQRIFREYDAFINHLFTKVNLGFVPLREMITSYLNLESIIHPLARSQSIDFNALNYVLSRLPKAITKISSIFLTVQLPDMYSKIVQIIQLETKRSKKRKFFELIPGKSIVLLRDRETDIIDIVTKLCIYAVEVAKIRKRLEDKLYADKISIWVYQKGSEQEEEEIVKNLPFSDEEVVKLRELFGKELLFHLYEILAQYADIMLYFENSGMLYNPITWEKWTANVRDALGLFNASTEITRPSGVRQSQRVERLEATQYCNTGSFPIVQPRKQSRAPDAQEISVQSLSSDNAAKRDIDFHLIFSNTYSVVNCLSGWLHKNKNKALKWAEENIPQQLEGINNITHRLYTAERYWLKSHPEIAKERLACDSECGIHHIRDSSFSGIDVSIIEVEKLDTLLDPYLTRTPSSCPRVIINIDYSYGQQSTNIMHALLMLLSEKIRSISVLGKAGSLVGNRGDILIPSRIIMEASHEFYPLKNDDFTEERLKSFGFERDLYRGSLLTVRGTVMQSSKLLRFYQLFWNVVGLEMEGTYYLREVLLGIMEELIPFNIPLRFAYYASDLPLKPGLSLAKGMTSAEGSAPVYAITRTILSKILSEE